MLSRFTIGRRGLLLAATALFVLGVLATGIRTVKRYQTPGPFDPDNQGMCDFHNGIYFPTLALLEGVSPYGDEYARSRPVARQIPFFLPSILVLHAPFTWLPLGPADTAYFLFSVILVLLISGVIVSSVAAAGSSPSDGPDAPDPPIRLDALMAVAAAIVFSRGGHITLFDGYFTLELVLATFLAIRWADRKPVCCAMALVIVASKPTYILPLGFLLLARGNVKAIVLGALMTVTAAGAVMAWLAHHEGDGDMIRGAEILGEQIANAQEIHRGQADESPVFSWTRIDLLATVAKWTGDDPAEMAHLLVMAVILIPVMVILDRRRRRAVDDGLAGMTGSLILVCSLVSLYHQSYDALLLMAPLAGVIARSPRVWRDLARTHRLVIVFLLAVPVYNYLSTRMFLSRFSADPLLERVLTSANGVALAVLLALLVILCCRRDTVEQTV